MDEWISANHAAHICWLDLKQNYRTRITKPELNWNEIYYLVLFKVYLRRKKVNYLLCKKVNLCRK